MVVKGVFPLNDHSLIIKQVIGKTIKAIRIKQGLSQEDLAGLCQVDRSYISLVEVGKNEPSVSKIFELCGGLKVSPSAFFKIVESEYDKIKETDTNAK
ncbi:helix-turn-helix domain-containing protein [Paenibacillus sp. MSJ-34]|nr:helix-turn-helix domain-containing protein [Paenibacillus sp. MSJ-34]